MISVATRLLVVVSVVLSALVSSARAHDTYVAISDHVPVQTEHVHPQPSTHDAHPYPARARASIFKFGYRGMITGGLAGLGAGYFVARDEGDSTDVLIVSGIGALSGTALGLTLGIVDRLGAETAFYVSRDVFYGVCFGAIVGAIGGSLAWAGSGDSELVAAYAAGGSLAGVGLGVLIGIIEGQVRDEYPYDPYVSRKVDLSVARVGADQAGWGATVRGRF